MGSRIHRKFIYMQAPMLSGLAASAGVAEGRVQVFLPGSNCGEFQEGNILVTTLTDPTMIQAILKAAAIVTDMGGITSHPAIISREMGIPCVVNTKEATKILKSGARVRVDGAAGEIYALD